MRAMYFAVFLAFAVTLPAPAQAEQSYVWDGSSLQSVQTTQGITCSNWALWYFKRGVSQTPGSQWGAAVENSAEGVLKDQRESVKLEEDGNAVNAKYHLKGPDKHLYENYLGPICVTKVAFDAKPGAVQAIEDAGELAGRISSLISQVRTVLNGARTAIKTGYQGYYLQEGEKNQLEEYLDRIQEISENVGKVQNALMQRLGPTMMQINGQINTITKQLGEANSDLPTISKLVSAPAAPISTAWMSRVKQDGDDVTTIQEIPGGFSISFVSNEHGYFTSLETIQFANIKDVYFRQGSSMIDVALKAAIKKVDNEGGIVMPDDSVMIFFNNAQDAQDARNFLQAQIR